MPKRSRTDAPRPSQSVQSAFDRFTVKVFVLVLTMAILAVISMGPMEALRRIGDSLAGATGFVEDLPGAY